MVGTLGTGADPASQGEEVATDLVQAHAGFLDLVAAGHQVEQTRPLADSTKAMLDALVTTDAAGFKSAYEAMRLSLIAWVDRNGWNH